MPKPTRADEAGLLYRAHNRGNLFATNFQKCVDLEAFDRMPMSRLPAWVERVNTLLSEAELAAVRLSSRRGKPLGGDGWGESIARCFKLESTMRPRGRG